MGRSQYLLSAKIGVISVKNSYSRSQKKSKEAWTLIALITVDQEIINVIKRLCGYMIMALKGK